MFRRHFFLIIAVVIVAVMAVAGAVKVLTMKKPGGGGGAPMAQGGPGGGGGGRGPGGGGFGGGRGGMATPVSVATIRPRMFTDRIEVLGVAKGRQSVTMTSNTAEMVDRVRFRPGDAVRQGQVLIELRRTEEDAGIAQARANMDLARVNAERWNTLAAQGVAAKATADQYQSAYLAARASLEAAESRLNDRVIRAPFSGVVGLSDIAPGALISPGTAIVTLDDLSVIRVDFDVPDRYLSLVREGGAIQATSDAYPGERYAGRIAKLDTRIDERSRSFKVRAELPNPGGRLKPGMLIRVGIDRGTRMGLAAPEAAVQFSGGQAYVYVVAPRQGGQGGAPGANGQGGAAKGGQNNAQGGAPKGGNGGPNGGQGGANGGFMAQQRPILTGLNDCGFIEVRDGLEAGERIVADGLNKITPNQSIRPEGMGRGGRGPNGAGPNGGAPVAPQSGPQGKAPAAKGEGQRGPGAVAQGPAQGQARGAAPAGGRGGNACASTGQVAGRMGPGAPGGGMPAGRPGMGQPPQGGFNGGGMNGAGSGRPNMPRGSAAAPQ